MQHRSLGPPSLEANDSFLVVKQHPPVRLVGEAARVIQNSSYIM